MLAATELVQPVGPAVAAVETAVPTGFETVETAVAAVANARCLVAQTVVVVRLPALAVVPTA